MNDPASRPAQAHRGGLIRGSFVREIRGRPSHPILSELAIGSAAGVIAVGIRYCLPLQPEQIPTLSVVVTVAIVTTFIGAWAGITTAIVGGLLSWYLFFNPDSWSLAHGQWVPLLGFTVIAAVIITTSHLYRSSERRRHEIELDQLKAQAEDSEMFAREMAHRLKNALAIVQSIAYQTIGTDSPQSTKFASRLKALAEANDLLNEDVRSPSADVVEVIRSALEPFDEQRRRFHIASVKERVASQQVISLALAIHELATNAVKYGALSVPQGTVRIDLERTGAGLLLKWRERGGPTVRPPAQTGFGTRLLRRAAMNAHLEFEPDGLACSMILRVV